MTQTPFDNIETLIEKFGGMRPMARKMNVPVSTLQGWKKRNAVPEDRVQEVIQAAKTHNIPLNTTHESAKQTINTQHIETVTIQDNIKTENTENKAKAQSRPIETRQAKPAVTPPQRARAHRTSDIESPTGNGMSAWIVLFFIGALAALIGFFLMAGENKQEPLPTITAIEPNNRINQLENQFTNSLDQLSNTVGELSATVGIERDENGNISLKEDMTIGQRIDALETGIQNINTNEFMNSMQMLSDNNNATLSDLKGIITIIQGRMDQIDAGLEQVKSENEQLAQSLENVNGRDVSAAAMLLALTQFRASMDRNEPFVDDLNLLQELVGEQDPELTNAIDRLAPYAQNGVLTPQGLSKELRSVAGDIIAAKLRGDDVSVQDRFLSRLGQIISVEKDGKPLIATREQEIISAAQQALEAGDTQKAMEQLKQLEGEPAQAAAPFMQQLQGTVIAEETSGLVMQKLVETLKSPNGLQNIMDILPAELQNLGGGGQTVIQDEASGIILLE
jgi:hypothetical protein